MKAKRSLVKIPYRAFKGSKLIVRGLRNRGIYKIEVLDRVPVKGETQTDFRYMVCMVTEVIRGTALSVGNLALLPIEHSIKEPVKTLYPIEKALS